MLTVSAALMVLFTSLTTYAATDDAASSDSLVVYVREGWPMNGQPFKKYQPDAGRLLASPPEGLEEVWCGIWAQCDFDEKLEKPITVESAYVNVWLYSVNGKGTSAFDFDGGFDDKTTASTEVAVTPENAKSRRYRYDLHCYYMKFDKPVVLDPAKKYTEDGSAYRLTYKWLAPGQQPILSSAPGMQSFIWLNPPPPDVLTKRDSDGDGISDQEEISKYFTNPFLADSDADGIPDKYEIKNGTDPDNNDTDLDSIADNEDKNPTSADFDEVLDAPQYTKDAAIKSKSLLVKTGITVKNGATLKIEDCEVVLDGPGPVPPYLSVSPGSALVAKNCRFRSIDGRELFMTEIGGRIEMTDCDVSDANTIRLRGDGSKFVKCRFDYNYKTFEITGSKNTFDDCEFDHSHFGLHFKLMGKASGNVIKGCKFDHALFSSVEMHEDATGNVIDGCEMKRSDHAVVLKSKVGKNTVRRCTFRLNNSSVSISSPENVVEKNRFNGSAWGHITLSRANGNIIRENTIMNAEISIWDDCCDNVFEKNWFEAVPGKAVLLKNRASRNVFRENTFKDISGPCIVICKDCNENVVEGNVIVEPCGPVEVEEGAKDNLIRIKTKDRIVTKTERAEDGIRVLPVE